MIKLEHVSKTFKVKKNNIEALKDVSVEVKKGEIYGVIGYSGAGKSTLIRCVNLLERPTNGKVYVDGEDVLGLDKKGLRKLRRKIGMIFQGYNLLATATVYENVAIPLKLEGLSNSEIKKRTEKYLDIVGLTDRSKAYPSQLSGGQKQRVAIARALAHEPEVLLSDEATSALDPTTTESILELLLKVNKELGITIFLITHELDVIQRICDRVAVMDKGRIVEEGTVLEIFAHPKEAITKRFVEKDTVSSIPAEMLNDFQATGKLVALTFLGESAKDPALATLAKNYDVLPSIIAGGIDQLKNQSIGKLLVHIKGESVQVEEAIQYLRSEQIAVEEVKS